ncbi:MAG: hypothetical protein U9N36_07330 [Euryarchaeota archaeon]|nr:hypothetical protein [Euryarchaeota archaeon]
MVRELYVTNTGDAVERVLLTMAGTNLTVDQLELDLAAKENRAVAVSTDHSEAGEHEERILITACPSGDAARGLGLGAGVRVPVSFVMKGWLCHDSCGNFGRCAAPDAAIGDVNAVLSFWYGEGFVYGAEIVGAPR